MTAFLCTLLGVAVIALILRVAEYYEEPPQEQEPEVNRERDPECKSRRNFSLGDSNDGHWA